MGYLIPEEDQKLLTARELNVLRLFGEADSLAIHFQKRRDRYLYILLILSFLTTLFAGLYSDTPSLFPYNPDKSFWEVYLFCFSLCIASAYGIFLIKRGRIPILQSKFKDDPEVAFEDYRALAEGLRVQIFWNLVGIRACVSDHYLSRQKEGLGWVCNILRDVHLRLMADSEQVSDLSARQELARKHWVLNQRDWFKSKLNIKSKKMTLKKEMRLWKRLSTYFFFGSFIVVGIMLLDLWWNFCDGHHFLKEPWDWSLPFLMAFLPVCAGLMRFYIELTGMEETTDQYERILAVYEKSCRMLGCGSVTPYASPCSPDDVYFQLGCEALAEHGDWLLFHRHNEVRVAC